MRIWGKMKDISQDNHKKRILDRIKVNVQTGCWKWTGPLQSNGHPRYFDGTRYISARKASCLAFDIPIRKGCQIFTTCNNVKCVNPKHLRVSSSTHSKKKFAPITRMSGEANPMSKLRVIDIVLIRELAKEGESIKIIAKQFGTNRAHIRNIIRRKSWGHVR